MHASGSNYIDFDTGSATSYTSYVWFGSMAANNIEQTRPTPRQRHNRVVRLTQQLRPTDELVDKTQELLEGWSEDEVRALLELIAWRLATVHRAEDIAARLQTPGFCPYVCYTQLTRGAIGATIAPSRPPPRDCIVTTKQPTSRTLLKATLTTHRTYVDCVLHGHTFAFYGACLRCENERYMRNFDTVSGVIEDAK